MPNNNSSLVKSHTSQTGQFHHIQREKSKIIVGIVANVVLAILTILSILLPDLSSGLYYFASLTTISLIFTLYKTCQWKKLKTSSMKNTSHDVEVSTPSASSTSSGSSTSDKPVLGPSPSLFSHTEKGKERDGKHKPSSASSDGTPNPSEPPPSPSSSDVASNPSESPPLTPSDAAPTGNPIPATTPGSSLGGGSSVDITPLATPSSSDGTPNPSEPLPPPSSSDVASNPSELPLLTPSDAPPTGNPIPATTPGSSLGGGSSIDITPLAATQSSSEGNPNPSEPNPSTLSDALPSQSAVPAKSAGKTIDLREIRKNRPIGGKKEGYEHSSTSSQAKVNPSKIPSSLIPERSFISSSGAPSSLSPLKPKNENLLLAEIRRKRQEEIQQVRMKIADINHTLESIQIKEEEAQKRMAAMKTNLERALEESRNMLTSKIDEKEIESIKIRIENLQMSREEVEATHEQLRKAFAHERAVNQALLSELQSQIPPLVRPSPKIPAAIPSSLSSRSSSKPPSAIERLAEEVSSLRKQKEEAENTKEMLLNALGDTADRALKESICQETSETLAEIEKNLKSALIQLEEAEKEERAKKEAAKAPKNALAVDPLTGKPIRGTKETLSSWKARTATWERNKKK